MTIVGVYLFPEEQATMDPADREYKRLFGYDTETQDWTPQSDARKTARIPDEVIQAVNTPQQVKEIFSEAFTGRTHVVATENEIPGTVDAISPPEEPEPLN